jgi:hypothetical protein
MIEDPSLPPPFSRMEIATIAAMLLGEISEDSKYRSACESAVKLLSIAEEVASKYNPETQDLANIAWELLDQNVSEASPDLILNQTLLELGFKNGSQIDPESDIRIPWHKFWKDILHPKKPAKNKEVNLKGWLRSKVSNEEASSILSNAKDYGVSKRLIIMYLKEFQEWFKGCNSRRNSESARVGVRKRKSAGK